MSVAPVFLYGTHVSFTPCFKYSVLDVATEFNSRPAGGGLVTILKGTKQPQQLCNPDQDATSCAMSPWYRTSDCRKVPSVMNGYMGRTVESNSLSL